VKEKAQGCVSRVARECGIKADASANRSLFGWVHADIFIGTTNTDDGRNSHLFFSGNQFFLLYFSSQSCVIFLPIWLFSTYCDHMIGKTGIFFPFRLF